mgnify:CR=1 FL=1
MFPFEQVIWVAVGFMSGALPFSLWVGALWLRRDIRQVGDANPGATNVWRAGGRYAAAVAFLLDVLKGAIPVGVAYLQVGITGAWLIAIALAPVLGHAFSPILGGRGGKAVAVSMGIWAGLTAWEGPTVGGVTLLLASRLVGANGWAVLLACLAIFAYVTLAPAAWNGLMLRPDPATLGSVALGNLLIVAWKYRADLATTPRLFPKARS